MIGIGRSAVWASTSFASFAASRADELQVRHPAGQPEDQLVEEQDQAVVAQGVGVPRDHRQAPVERDERLPLVAGEPLVGREDWSTPGRSPGQPPRVLGPASSAAAKLAGVPHAGRERPQPLGVPPCPG